MRVHHMQIESVNVGQAETISHNGKSMRTGICKTPRVHAVRVTTLGLLNDAVCNEEHHGGVDQAVYAYSLEDYEWWAEELGTALPPGTFGDNLTIRGMPTDMQVGDRLLIGDVVLEATSPRIPCSTLSMRLKDSSFALDFRRAERPGIYFRVLNEGELRAGDAVTFVENEQGTVTISDLVRFYYDLSPEAIELERLLLAPVGERFREKIEKKLAALSD